MWYHHPPSHQSIHRHTGGLEMIQMQNAYRYNIHRHTGGLEIDDLAIFFDIPIHRHTGGLEKAHKTNGR